ncbi:potassium channel family protein [Thiofilum flexile]|uniref:potassium channel family protein n=1 Tax=Thiofilum flexile TaxID=125627 RepID=UPI001B7FA8EA|nr:potassium channel family protein [Thiofilum flexile]
MRILKILMARYSGRGGVKANMALLIAMIIHNLIYPLSNASGIWPGIFYLYYSSIFVLGTWALTPDYRLRYLVTFCGMVALIAGMLNTYVPAYAPSGWASLMVAITSILYHGVMCFILAQYTFRARKVMTDIVISATTLYLVIGSGFAAIFATIEWIEPGSFVASSGAKIQWQQLLYYSYVTLTTLGYGDITPAYFYAQAFASFEALTGVLYTVILLSRLVGLYSSQNND